MPKSLYTGSGSDPDRHRIDVQPSAVRTRSASRLQSFSESDSWEDINPEDAGSQRSRQPSAVRYTAEAPQPPSAAPSRARSYRAPNPEPEHAPPRRRHDSSSRPRRADSYYAPSESSFADTLASPHDDLAYGRRGMGSRSHSAYRHIPAPGHGYGHGGYGVSAANSQYYDPYPQDQHSLVHMPPMDAFGGYPRMSPLPSAAPNAYYPDPYHPNVAQHRRPSAPRRPQSYAGQRSHYDEDVYADDYGAYGGAEYPLAAAGWPYPVDRRNSYSPNNELERLKAVLARQKEEKEIRKQEELDSLKALVQKHEAARIERERDMVARAEAEAAAMAAARAKEEEEKRLAAASKSAKEAAETKAAEAAKKAQEDADKKLKEAQDAKEKAEKKQKELEEEAKKNKPPDDHALAPIVFNDAVGRKFVFPFHVCKTWKGMESLIRQAFAPVDHVVDRVRNGEFDLTGPEGQIILPGVWDTMIKPSWEVTMTMWPEPDRHLYPDPYGPLPDMFGGMRIGDKKGGHKSSKNKTKRNGSPGIVGPPLGGMSGLPPLGGRGGMPPPPPPPPPPGAFNMPAGVLPDPLGGAFGPLDFGDPIRPKKKSSSSKPTPKASKSSGRISWFGSSKPSKKK